MCLEHDNLEKMVHSPMGIHMNGRLIFLNEKACHTHKEEGKALNVIAIRKKVVLPSHSIGVALGLPLLLAAYKKN